MITAAQLFRLRSQSACRRFIDATYKGDDSAFIQAVDSGLTTVLRMDIRKAARYLVSAERCFGHVNPPETKPRLAAMKARLSYWKGQFVEAVKLYRVARKTFSELGDTLAAARIDRAMIEVHMYLDQYDKALKVGRSALRIFESHGSESEAAQVMTNIGNVYHRLDRNREALRMYDKAHEVFAKSGGVPLAIIEFNRANVYANLRDLKKSGELYQVAESLYRKAGMEVAANQAVYSLAYLAFLDDRYSWALNTFEKVFDNFQRLGDRRSAAVTQLDLIELNTHLGQPGIAVLLAEGVIAEFRRLRMGYEQAKAHYFAAQAYRKLGHGGPATRHLRRAEKRFVVENNLLWQGMIAHERSQTLFDARRYRQALVASTNAGRLFSRCGDVRRSLDAKISRAAAQLFLNMVIGRYGLHRCLARHDLTSSQRLRVHQLLGEYAFQRKDFKQALACFASASAIVETMLTGLADDETVWLFTAQSQPVIGRTVECLLRLDRTQEAFRFDLRSLATINRQFLPHWRRTAPPHLVAQAKQLRQELNRLQRVPCKGERTVLGSVVQIERRLLSVERHMRALSGDTLQLPRSLPVSADVVVDPQETVVRYIALDNWCGAIVTTAQEAIWIEFSQSPGNIEVTLRKLLFLMELSVTSASPGGRATILDLMGQLHDTVVAPIRSYLRTKHVTIFADSLFAQMPIGSLCAAGQPPLRRAHDLRLAITPHGAYDSRGLVTKRQRHAIVAVPSPDLPSVLLEVRAASQYFPAAATYLREQATVARLQEVLRDYDGFVHIASHASRAPENPLFSRVLMTDGPFFPFDLQRCGIAAKLVVLSGCQTAAPGLYGGNSMSLARVFHRAGARFVLASLWTVSDRWTMYFMGIFYQHLAANGDIPDAYAKAVDALEEVTDDPALFSVFTLIGK
jgi:tetratricopeptide (TPR) repeat protein